MAVSNPYKKPEKGSIQKRGSKGESVRYVQFELNDSGASLIIDGDFGPATESAVKTFQRKYKLEVDGKVGNLTRAEFLKRSNSPSAPATPPPVIDDGIGWIIDVSEYDRNVNWEKLLSLTGEDRILFVILRAQGKALDKKFKRNVRILNELQERGFTNVQYGVYSYSYSYTEKEGKLEAEKLLRRCNAAGARPVAYYYDSEETEARNKAGKITRKATTVEAAKGWLKAMKAAKLNAYLGFYSMDSRCTSWKSTVALFDGCWTARWNTPDIAPNYKTYHLWQHGYKYKVKGLVRGYVDCSRLKKGLTINAMLATRAA